ncbi:hypothetical protein BDN70DRAFT_892637 [Pholiota conissans]|uniref:Uncharacterized protein n=1 Tax=Pholiota conissans TaxID=109636 RepID=A0A9P6CWV0_9AGAR|nr:hypothetical protein BDN70DRAFT_892637 [Pholiota conissans]
MSIYQLDRTFYPGAKDRSIIYGLPELSFCSLSVLGWTGRAMIQKKKKYSRLVHDNADSTGALNAQVSVVVIRYPESLKFRAPAHIVQEKVYLRWILSWYKRSLGGLCRMKEQT